MSDAETVDGTLLLQVKPRWRGVSHEIAAFVFPVLGLILVAIAPTTAARWSALVYTVGVTAMYATSACYHRGDWTPPVRQRLRRLDHSMILVGIAATYTPIAVVGLDPRSARILLSSCGRSPSPASSCRWSGSTRHAGSSRGSTWSSGGPRSRSFPCCGTSSAS